MYRFIKSNKYLNRQWLFLSILVVAVIMLRLPALSQPFDNDSGANAYHARLILRGEPLYSTHHPAHHLPGVYYTYTVAFLLLGDSTWSIKVLLIPWTILTAYIIYLYGKQLDRELTGYLASFFFILLTSHVFLKGHTAETELFANLPITAAIFLAVYLTINNAKNWLFTFVGVICAVAFLYKAVFLSPIIIVGIILIVDALLTKEKVDSWQISARRIFWTACGFVVPILIVLILFARIELLSRLLLVFTLGQGYTVDQASRVGIFQVIYLPFYVLAINNLAILFLSIAGFVNLARRIRKKIYSDNPFIITAIALILWYLLTFITAGITRRAWAHYSLIIIPPFSILAAWEISQAYRRYRIRRRASNRKSTPLPLVLILVGIVFVSAITNSNQYNHYIRYKLGNESYEEFLTQGFLLEGKKTVALLEIADYIQSRTNPDDYIYYWSDHPQLYYYADRQAPIDLIWPYYATATSPYQRIFTPKTKYIILGESIFVSKPDWFFEELRNSYYLETEIGGQEVFRRIDG